MKVLSAVSALVLTMLGGMAHAHNAAVPHTHPHLHTVDGALLGLDVLTIVTLTLFAVAFAAASALSRARRKK